MSTVETLPQAANVGFSFTFRFDLAGDEIESVDGEDDQEPSTPVSTPPPSPTILPVSPMKGSPREETPNAANEKVIAASARGLKGMVAVSPSKRTGLFKIFSKETEQEKREREAREKEAAELKAEQRAEEELQKTRNQIVVADEKREAAKKRKREERERRYFTEVEAGIRNDDFTLKTKKKRKVELRDEPNVNNMAEVTRPARQIEQRYKEKNRTHPTGREEDENFARAVVDCESAIAKDLQARDPTIFADLTATTIQVWFERDDPGIQIWKKSVLESAKLNGNTPGHAMTNFAPLCKRSLAAKTRSSSSAAIFSSLPSPFLQCSEGERAQYGAGSGSRYKKREAGTMRSNSARAS
ncbi:hypothetical protein B0H14DRAFT_2630160 [Mycena olivaceomarginata]|nr:hypothetical protein B0H14DRAFT_2630160 [Mycena olivaceomarginata]